jgi:hypothetical protein
MIVINPNIMAVSTHSAELTSVCGHDGVLYGASSSGLVSFDGDPSGITLQTGDIDFGGNRKGIVSADVAMTAGGMTTLTATPLVHGRGKALGPCLVVPIAADEASTYHVKLGKGHAGNAYSFAVSAAGDAQIDYIDMEVQPRRRHQ